MARLMFITLTIAVLGGLWPTPSHMPSMQGMHMDSVLLQRNNVDGNVQDHSMSSCCNAIGTLVLACDFVPSDSAHVLESGDSEQVAYSVPIFQSTYIRTLAPPPKI
jgi:hypothetical protein